MKPRICILGNGGSGKSTLAKALGAKFSVPVYHLDRLLLDKDFNKFSLEETEQIHEEIINQDGWVMDGGYHNLLPARFARATLVVFIDIGRVTAISRAIRRAKKGGQPADVIPDGAKAEKMSWVFLKYLTKYNRRKRLITFRKLCEDAGVPLVVLKPGSVDGWVNAVEKIIAS